jgi:DNA-binding transcriptional regulator YiaG
MSAPWLALAIAANHGEANRAREALAAALAVSPRTVNRWSRGATRPGGPEILAIRNLAAHLGVPSPV